MQIAIGSVAVALALAAPAGRAHGEERESHLDAAERAFEDLDFRTARSLLDTALRSGDNAPASLQRAHLLSGIVAASFGEKKAAVRAFRRALAIDPDATLPDGLAPKITAPFAAAREQNGLRKLAVGCADSGRSGSIFVAVDSDPLGMVAGAVVRYRDDLGIPRTETLADTRRFVFAIPDEATGWVQVAVVDEHGNQLARPCAVQVTRTHDFDADFDDVEGEAGSGVDGATSAPSQMLNRASARYRRRPLVARWYVWGTLSLGLAAAGTYYGLAARDSATELSLAIADSGSHEFSEVEAIERRGRREARTSTVTFAAAAGAAVLGAILWLATDDGPAPRRRATVSAAPSQGGASVGFTFAF